MEGKVVMLTGATRGLGRAMTERFIEAGHTVVGCGRSAREVEQLKQAHGEPHTFEVVDVTDAAAVSRWAEQSIEKHGAPDFLLNNAALINRNAPLWEVPREEFDTLIDVNIKGVVNVLRAFLPAMIERKSGVIVNFSSGWGRSVSPEVAPYCASKWAIEGLTKALAEELPTGMAAVPLNPGVINTDMLQSCFGGSASSYPTADEWSWRAVPFLLRLGAEDNGQSLSVT